MKLNTLLSIFVAAVGPGVVAPFAAPQVRPSIARPRPSATKTLFSTRQNEPTSAGDDDAASKRGMLKFAIPALGIYLMNPLLSNIDNAFVGRTVGAAGLAALSPATLCIDQALYMFSFLSRATTGLASRAYADGGDEIDSKQRLSDAASPAFSVALFCGLVLSLTYTLRASNVLNLLRVDQQLFQSAAKYIQFRGISSWAALSQSILLALFMVSKDAVTPLKIISLAAAANVVGDWFLCSWPLRLGCAGAAAATSLATFISSAMMVYSLRKRHMMPRIKMPTKAEFYELLGFTGPLLAITITRMAGFVNMQKTALRLGTDSLAGYQLVANLNTFFLLFGEPLSQLAQTKLPSLIDSNQTKEAFDTFKSLMLISLFAAAGVGVAAGCTAFFAPGLFSSSLAVQTVSKSTAPVLCLSVAATVVAIAVDGSMMASKDFSWMLGLGLSSFFVQSMLLSHCSSVQAIFWTFTLRLASYAVLSVARALLGYGHLGRAIRRKRGH